MSSGQQLLSLQYGEEFFWELLLFFWDSVSLLFHCFCLLFHGFCLLFHCFCLLFHCFCLLFHCFCLLFLPFCLLFLPFCLLFHPSIHPSYLSICLSLVRAFFSPLSQTPRGRGGAPYPQPPSSFFYSVGPPTIYLSIDGFIYQLIYLSTNLPIYLSTYRPIHLSTHLPTYLSFCHSSVLAFLMLHPPSSIQNPFSTFFLVFFEIHAFILLSIQISTFSLRSH